MKLGISLATLSLAASVGAKPLPSPEEKRGYSLCLEWSHSWAYWSRHRAVKAYGSKADCPVHLTFDPQSGTIWGNPIREEAARDSDRKYNDLLVAAFEALTAPTNMQKVLGPPDKPSHSALVCLEVARETMTAGSPVFVKKCKEGAAAQQFTLQFDGRTSRPYIVPWYAQDLCLTVSPDTTKHGNLVLQPCSFTSGEELWSRQALTVPSD